MSQVLRAVPVGVGHYLPERVVENVVDAILSNEESMLTLTAIRDYDEYTYHHSFNVCIYSIALGNRPLPLCIFNPAAAPSIATRTGDEQIVSARSFLAS